ncbi:MAG: hypothetical protein AAAFM81_05570 [Pseudomonadota bacterium]
MHAIRTNSVGASLEETFKAHKDAPWVFLRGLGNWGDDFLFAGAEALANRLGLDWRDIPLDTFPDVDLPETTCVYIHGSGGFNPWCSGSAITNLKHATSKQIRLALQGPMSVGGDADWLSDVMTDVVSDARAEEIIVFTREQYSYDAIANIKGLVETADVRLDQDSALYLQVDEILSLAGLDSLPEGNYDLVVVREDPEAGKSAGEQTFPGVQLDPAYAANSFAHWIRMHLGAKHIATNRLHSSIIGTLAGKQVTVGPGSYHKNRSVYEQSLVHRNVAWSDNIGVRDKQWWFSLPTRVRTSYKANLARLFANGIPTR